MTEQLPQSPEDPAPPPEGSRFAKAHHVLLIFLALVLLGWLLSGYYQVNNDQIAIVERLGTYLVNADGSVRQIPNGPPPCRASHGLGTPSSPALPSTPRLVVFHP